MRCSSGSTELWCILTKCLLHHHPPCSHETSQLPCLVDKDCGINFSASCAQPVLMPQAFSQSLIISPCVIPSCVFSPHLSLSCWEPPLALIMALSSSFGQQYHYQTINTIKLFSLLISESFIQFRIGDTATTKLNCKVILWLLMHVLRISVVEQQWPWILFNR